MPAGDGGMTSEARLDCPNCHEPLVVRGHGLAACAYCRVRLWVDRHHIDGVRLGLVADGKMTMSPKMATAAAPAAASDGE